jgi:mRNA-degrading endonuclease toxin of MazEF toxin-antitoxin module
MNVGDVNWVEFPPRNGHVQTGRRPTIIAQDPSTTTLLPATLVIPLTTQLGALRFPGTVLIDPETGNGLRRPSVALVFQLTVLDRRFLGTKMGRVSETILKALWSALDEITGRIELSS